MYIDHVVEILTCCAHRNVQVRADILHATIAAAIQMSHYSASEYVVYEYLHAFWKKQHSVRAIYNV